MAEIKISMMDAAAALSGAEVAPLVQAGGNVKVTLAELKAWALKSPENAQTGTAYTLVIDDAFKLVTMANVAANALTVPPNASVPFPTGTRVDIGQDGAGQTTVVQGAGVTIRTTETLLLRKQWAKATLIKRAADLWDLTGEVEAAP